MIDSNCRLKYIRCFVFTVFLCGLSSFSRAQGLIVSSGSANNFLITYPASIITTPPSGMMVTFKSNQASLGGVCNLNVNSTGSFPIKKFVTQNLAAGDIQTGHFVTVIFDGSVWHMISSGSQDLGVTSQWTTSGVNIYYSGGNVGIGTSIPGQALVAIGNSSVTGIGYFGTITGNNLTGAAGSIITVDGFGKLGLGTITSGLSGIGSSGSVSFWTSASNLSNDATNFFWDNTNKRLGIGINSPSYRIHSVESAINGRAIYGFASASSGTGAGVVGETNSPTGTGVYGLVSLTTGVNYGVYGQSQSSSGIGVYGLVSNSSGTTYGVYGSVNSTTNFAAAVYGISNGLSGLGIGVYGTTASSTGAAVYGQATVASGVNYGVWGKVASAAGYAGYFQGGMNYFQGNVGIGTLTPVAPLQVVGAATISGLTQMGSAQVFNLAGPGLVAVDPAGNLVLNANPAINSWSINGSNLFPQNLNNKVGIGTSLPGQALVVVGNSSATGIGFFGTIIGNNLNGPVGSIVTVDGTGKLGFGANAASGPAGGDLINNYPGPTVAKIQGYSVSATAPSNGQILYYNGANWLPGTIGGDLAGSYPGPTVVKIQGYGVSATAPLAGQMLYYSAGWQPGSPGGDLTGSFPSPTIAAGAITSAKIAASAVNLTSQVTGVLPVANGGTGTSTAYTSGWVLFAGVSGVHSASSSLFWNNSSNRLGIGTSTPLNSLDVSGGVAVGTFAAANTAPTNGLIVSGNLGIGVAAPGFSLDVAGAAVIGGPNANLGPASLTYLQNSAKLLIGWNKSSGSGEADFIANRGAGTNGGFRFYDYTNAGVLSQLGLIDPTGAVFFGYLAGNVNTDNSNTGFGYQALSLNTSGNQNSAFGYEALMNNTGLNNTAHGFFALLGNTTGNYNTASGQGSCQNSSTGSYNTAYGSNALYNVGAGSYNTAVGQAAQQTNNGGGNNTSVGYHALYNISTGTSNTSIGYSADVATGTFTNATAIGASSSASASNKVRLGNTTITVVEGQVAYTYPSDARFKENVKEDIQGLDFIMKLRPVSYNFNRLSMAKHIKEKTEGRETELQELYKNRSSGFLAQEIEQLIKDTHFDAFDAVHAPTNEHDNYSLSYSHFVVPLVKAVQEQQYIIDSLINQTRQLKTSLDLIGSFNKEALQKLTSNQENGKNKATILEQYISKLELQMSKLSTENTGLKNEIEDIKKHLGIGIVSKK